MDPALFPRGLAIGFAIAAPVGPIGVLVIRRTLAHGRLAGLVSGVGAASADALYGALAAFGLTFLSSVLVRQSGAIRLGGGVFLCYLGVTTLLSQPAEQVAAAGWQRLGRAYLSTVFLTLANPATIISFVAVFAGLGLAGSHAGYASAALLVLGVFLGSVSWWLLLSGSIGLLRRRFTVTGLRWVNRLSGAIILAFGVAALVSLL
ncbi:MAG: LysE family transporter [Chloroflexi bacterium]|nr:LysE family transporter [Chloroflexota bacterium]